MEELSEDTILGAMTKYDLVVKMPPVSEHVEYADCSCWIEEDDPPTVRQLIDGLMISAIMWGGTSSSSKALLQFYAGHIKRCKHLLLKRLGNG